ncbi:hypothetical protein BLA29_006780, partial [Euroglyphus maynei]
MICTTILSLPNGFDTQGGVPFGAIMREAVQGFRNIQRNVQQRIQNRQRQPNGYEFAQDIREAIAEDIQQNHGRRKQKLCEYLRQGQAYRGPCPADGYDDDGGGSVGNYGDATNGAYVEEDGRSLSRQEAKFIRRQEKERRRKERRERKRQRNREREDYEPSSQPYEKDFVQPDKETKLIIRINPPRGGGNNN